MGLPVKKINNTQVKHKKEKWKNSSSMRLIEKKQSLKSIRKQPRYFNYILKWDSGLAPNPFHGFCTLAVCKPYIRKTAQVEDWIIGLGSSNQNNLKLNYRDRLIYAMKVTEKITFNKYWADKRFFKKRQNANSAKGRCGDNMYYMNSKGDWVQKTYEAHNTPANRKRDTSIDAVLVSKHFFYFGEEYINVPKSFQQSVSSKLTQGHRYKGLEKEGKTLIEFLEQKYKKGCHGNPIGYKEDNRGCETKRTSRISISRKNCGT